MPSAHVRQAPRATNAFGPVVAFIAAIAVTAVIGFGGLFDMHADYILPLATTVLFVLAACVAAIGWRTRGARNGGLTYWDIAGAILFIGIIVSASVEPDQIVRMIQDGRPR